VTSLKFLLVLLGFSSPLIPLDELRRTGAAPSTVPEHVSTFSLLLPRRLPTHLVVTWRRCGETGSCRRFLSSGQNKINYIGPLTPLFALLFANQQAALCDRTRIRASILRLASLGHLAQRQQQRQWEQQQRRRRWPSLAACTSYQGLSPRPSDWPSACSRRFCIPSHARLLPAVAHLEATGTHSPHNGPLKPLYPLDNASLTLSRARLLLHPVVAPSYADPSPSAPALLTSVSSCCASHPRDSLQVAHARALLNDPGPSVDLHLCRLSHYMVGRYLRLLVYGFCCSIAGLFGRLLRLDRLIIPTHVHTKDVLGLELPSSLASLIFGRSICPTADSLLYPFLPLYNYALSSSYNWFPCGVLGCIT
jgi:hypothetical protein